MCKKADKAQEANDSGPKKSVTMSDDVAIEEGMDGGQKQYQMPDLPRPLTLEEKKFLLAVERGDTSSVRKMLQKAHRHSDYMNMNCVDPLGRGALHMAIDNENLEMIELLVVMGVETRDALLHAIDVEFVEAVEVLLEHEEVIHKEGEPYSWERIDKNTASFTPEITPLILAAHRDNYEILKILIDRGATLPMPHDIRCGCEECIKSSSEDSLRHSMARISAYRALASPSLIALSSTDPILTAFELSWELKNLAYAEHEFRAEYVELRKKCMAFAEELLSHTRSSTELAVILNHDPGSPVPYEDGEHMKLHRLEQAIDYKQKKFVAHPNIQQLLAAIWYEGLPGFRRRSPKDKLMEIVKIVALFPFYCFMYIVCPGSAHSRLMRKPFMKFLMHSASYLFFLLMLILVSVRFEELVIRIFGTESMRRWLDEAMRRQRGSLPTPTECIVVIYVLGFLWEEIREMQREGLGKYLRNMWNLMDIMRDFLYMTTLFLRIYAYVTQRIEISNNPQVAFIPREDWDSFDAQLISEGMFAAANILSALKLVHIFSINPYLGPLQISLGRMVIDIVKFFFIYTLVLFAFACGLTQLLWYYNDLERQKCYSLPGGQPDWTKQSDACMKWRRFANLFEASQSLFWAGFGMVGLGDFELTGIREYTRFWSMLMFGSYSVINIIVLLNLLIAMMSNSYSFIVEHADTEWKFARSKLWMSYFEEGNTLPPPFNLIPTPKLFMRLMGKNKDKHLARRLSSRTQSHRRRQRDYRYLAVMRAIIWRYVCSLQKRNDERPVNEDDISEVKGDISSLRFELVDLFKHNGMDVSMCARNSKAALGRKMRIWERRLMRDFHVSPAMGSEDSLKRAASTEDGPPMSASDKFRSLAKLAIANHKCEIADLASSGKTSMSQIGRTTSTDEGGQENLKKAMERARKRMEEGTPDGSPGSSRGCSPFPDLYTGPHLLDAIKSLDLTPENSPSTSPLPSTDKPWLKNKKDGQAVEPNMLTVPGRRSPSTLRKTEDNKSPSPVASLFSSNLKKKGETTKDDKRQDPKIPSVQVTSVSEMSAAKPAKAEEKKQENRAPFQKAPTKTNAAAPKANPAAKITPAEPKSAPAKSNAPSAAPTKNNISPTGPNKTSSSSAVSNIHLPKEEAQVFKSGEFIKPSQVKNGSAFKPSLGSANAPEAQGGVRIPPPQGPTGPRRHPEAESEAFMRRPQPIQLSKTKESEELESMDFVRRPRALPPKQDSITSEPQDSSKDKNGGCKANQNNNNLSRAQGMSDLTRGQGKSDPKKGQDTAKPEPPVISVIPCTPAPPETPIPSVTPPMQKKSQAPTVPKSDGKGATGKDQKPSTPPAATFQGNSQISSSDPLISTEGGKGGWL